MSIQETPDDPESGGGEYAAVEGSETEGSEEEEKKRVEEDWETEKEEMKDEQFQTYSAKWLEIFIKANAIEGEEDEVLKRADTKLSQDEAQALLDKVEKGEYAFESDLDNDAFNDAKERYIDEIKDRLGIYRMEKSLEKGKKAPAAAAAAAPSSSAPPPKEAVKAMRKEMKKGGKKEARPPVAMNVYPNYAATFPLSLDACGLSVPLMRDYYRAEHPAAKDYNISTAMIYTLRKQKGKGQFLKDLLSRIDVPKKQKSMKLKFDKMFEPFIAAAVEAKGEPETYQYELTPESRKLRETRHSGWLIDIPGIRDKVLSFKAEADMRYIFEVDNAHKFVTKFRKSTLEETTKALNDTYNNYIAGKGPAKKFGVPSVGLTDKKIDLVAKFVQDANIMTESLQVKPGPVIASPPVAVPSSSSSDMPPPLESIAPAAESPKEEIKKKVMMNPKCRWPGCNNVATLKCASCYIQDFCYCSKLHAEWDWKKIHREDCTGDYHNQMMEDI